MEPHINPIKKKIVLTKDVLLAKEMEYMLESEHYTEGMRLPSEREMASAFGVQRGTVRSALQILLDKGMILAKPRAGYFVATRRVDLNLNAYDSR